MFVSLIFGPDILIVFVPFFLIAVPIWAIVDVSTHSNTDFYEAGYSKTAWIIVIALLTFVFDCGFFTAIYYLIRVRPKLHRVEGLNKLRVQKSYHALIRQSEIV